MNIIGIDPSLISTALTVNGNIINYCRESSAMNKKGLSKWFSLAEENVKYKFVTYRDYKDYSDGEITKLKDYDQITNMIIDDILSLIDKNVDTKIGIEGYSYGSGDQNSIIDLVTFSTLLRKKLYDYISKDILVLSPTSLKLKSCQLTYKPIDIGIKKPKLEWKNNNGISGGKFTKREMMLSLIENESTDDTWINHCKNNSEILLSGKNIPKPYEDVNDSYILYLILKNNLL